MYEVRTHLVILMRDNSFPLSHAVCGIEPLSQLYARRYIQYPLPVEVNVGIEPTP
jgi:hypothetical protein